MRVSASLRMESDKLERLRDLAQARGQSVSSLMTDLIQEHNNGKPVEEVKKQPSMKTSFSIEHDLMVTFKEKMQEQGIPLEAALKAIVTNFIEENKS